MTSYEETLLSGCEEVDAELGRLLNEREAADILGIKVRTTPGVAHGPLAAGQPAVGVGATGHPLR